LHGYVESLDHVIADTVCHLPIFLMKALKSMDAFFLKIAVVHRSFCLELTAPSHFLNNH
jgi:hypothetical protein